MSYKITSVAVFIQNDGVDHNQYDGNLDNELHQGGRITEDHLQVDGIAFDASGYDTPNYLYVVPNDEGAILSRLNDIKDEDYNREAVGNAIRQMFKDWRSDAKRAEAILDGDIVWRGITMRVMMTFVDEDGIAHTQEVLEDACTYEMDDPLNDDFQDFLLRELAAQLEVESISDGYTLQPMGYDVELGCQAVPAISLETIMADGGVDLEDLCEMIRCLDTDDEIDDDESQTWLIPLLTNEAGVPTLSIAGIASAEPCDGIDFYTSVFFDQTRQYTFLEMLQDLVDMPYAYHNSYPVVWSNLAQKIARYDFENIAEDMSWVYTITGTRFAQVSYTDLARALLKWGDESVGFPDRMRVQTLRDSVEYNTMWVNVFTQTVMMMAKHVRVPYAVVYYMAHKLAQKENQNA